MTSLETNRTNYKKIKRLFTGSIVILTTASLVVLGILMYESNLIRYSEDIDSTQLQQLVDDSPELKEYLESEHQNEAHFLRIASLVQQNQQQELGRIIILLTIPVIALSGILGYMLAKRLLNPVEEAQASQDRFIQDAAHELRNPLATLNALIQNAREDSAVNQKKYDKLLTSLSRQVKRLVNINEDLLFLERDYVEGKVVKVNVSELLLDVMEDMQLEARNNKLKFVTKIEPNIYLKINPKDFVKLSKNIIENAIKYSKPSSKTIKVTMHPNKGKIRFEVKDSGIGISEQELEKVTQRFFRAKNANAHEGTGLGLSIVNKVTERYHAKLLIDSKSGKGTTVTVDFK